MDPLEVVYEDLAAKKFCEEFVKKKSGTDLRIFIMNRKEPFSDKECVV